MRTSAQVMAYFAQTIYVARIQLAVNCHTTGSESATDFATVCDTVCGNDNKSAFLLNTLIYTYGTAHIILS